MKFRLLFVVAMLMLPMSMMAQKGKAVEFSAEGLPEELLGYLNGSTSDKDKQKENVKVVGELRSAYEMMNGSMKQRVAGIFSYAVKAHLRGNPEITSLAMTMKAYYGTPNFGDWVAAMEQLKGRGAKAKPVNEFVEFSGLLLSERVLYRSSSCEWRFDGGTPFRIVASDGGVLVYFDSPADLHYASAKDAGVIHGTKGVYGYKENRWRGEGGRVDWGRTGLGAEACYADLGRYEVETKFPKFKADSVMFVNRHYFGSAIEGRLEEVLSGAMEPERYSYPRFRSYQRDFVIKDILPDVDYSGSFMMNGSKFITASSKHAASLIFNRGGERRLSVTSLKFTITPERLTAENALVALYVGEEDSISNTGVTVRYVPSERRVTLVNDARRNFYSPYIDTYHELDIYSESLVWDVGKDEVEFSGLGASGTVSTASFESSSYYTYKKYREIQGIDDVSPVKRVYDYAEANSYYFKVSAFADYVGLDMSQALLMVHTLAHHGLVSYNEITGYVLVKDKLEDYVKAFSHSKGFDYDALTLESTTRGVNARLSMGDRRLSMWGVEKFVVSDSLRVMVYPRGGRLSVGKNRSIHFDGRVDAGKFIMFVSDCDYSHEQFSFEMPKVDSVFFYVPEFDNADTDHMVLTPLYNLVGTLQVDMPNNHSGLEKNKQFPMFDSRENSFVYFDKPVIQGGQYTKDRFYFTLHPFTISSMGDFVTDSLKFNGVLTSANIFPDITYPLSVQRDYYLGFQVETPDAGYPAYGGKGTYTHHISLDHNGLRGNGRVDYLTSRSRSHDYLFLPDSMLAVTDTFYVREERGFPDIRNGRTTQRWLPYMDSMAVTSMKQGTAFAMYHDEATFRGRVSLQPAGATAAGTAVVKEATVASSRFALHTMDMAANLSDFTLRSNTFNDIAFTAKSVTTSVDYTKRRADILAPNGPVLTQLPLVKYEAYADKFSWEMDRKELDLINSTRETAEGLDAMDIRLRLGKAHDLPGARFVSTDPARHQLTYHSLRSNYHYEKGDLSSHGVYLINIADAAIAPNADTLHIIKGGSMRVLNNATAIFNRDSAFHLLYNADLLIEAADNYSGKGYIDYINDLNTPQRIFLSNITVNPQGTTIAQGTISDAAQFTLSSAFGFAGKVRAEGNRPHLYFDGGVRLLQTCIANEKLGLLAYADYTDPNHIHINVPELPTDWQGHRITASILMDKNTLEPQIAFLTNDRAADNELLTAHGLLTYLPDSRQYIIASEEKIDDPDATVQPYLALNTTDCTIEGEGPINFTLKPTQASFYAYGIASFGTKRSDRDNLATTFGLTFPIAQELINSMANNLKEDLRLTPTPAKTNPPLLHALIHHLGPDQGTATYAEYSQEGHLPIIPSPMQSMLLFDNIRWQYNPMMGYYYDGKIGLIAIGNQQLNLELKLKAQISTRANAQQIVIYLQAANDHWYYFKYDLSSQELVLYSSSGLWIDQIKALSPEQRRINKDGLGTFRYFVGSNTSEVSNYIRWFSDAAYTSPTGN